MIFLVAVALLLSAMPARGEEIGPRRSFVGVYSLLGAASGGVLGTALGGLHRENGSDDSIPLVKWGLGGAAMGGVLGYAIGREEAMLADRPTGTSTPSLRGSSACLGAIVGQVAGLAVSAIEEDPLDWESRAVWARIALGTLLGASVGALLPPLAIIPAPPSVSARQRALADEMRRIEPLIPEERIVPQVGAAGELGGVAQSRLSPAPEPAMIGRLNRSLAETEEKTLMGSSALEIGPVKRSRDVGYEAAPLEIPPVITSVIYLALVEGAVLGGCAVGSMGEEEDDLGARITWGASLGALAGLSFGASFSSPWQDNSAHRYGEQETASIGKRLSGIFIGGAVGSFLGAAAGAVLHNSSASFSNLDATRLSLGGNCAGLLAGLLLTRSPGP